VHTIRRPRAAAAIVAVALAVPAIGWASTNPFDNFSGSTDRGTAARISDHGNIIGFAGPTVAGGDYEHVNVGALSDGYVLCYRRPTTGAVVDAFDVGSAESGFAAAVPSAGGPDDMQVTRPTSDGALQLKQSFLFYGKEKRLEVAMSVINTNSFPVTGVILRRQSDFDVDGAGAAGWSGSRNLWAQTSRDSVFAWNEPSAAPAGKDAHGMLMTHRSTLLNSAGVYTELPPTARVAKVTESPLDSSCNPPAKTTPVTTPADDGATLQVNIGTIPAAPSPGSESSVTVDLVYQRI
jgi:hypothetical protein